MKRELYSYVLLGVFGLFLLGPLLGLRDVEVSVLENRRLERFPGWAKEDEAWVEWAAEMDAYVKDQYGFREVAVLWGRSLKWLVGSVAEALVVEGREGWLFFTGLERDRPMEDFAGLTLLNDTELEEWAVELSARRDWLAERGVEYVFVIAPNKAEVYFEYLPSGYKRREGLSRREQLVAYLRANTEVAVLDLTGGLLEAKKRVDSWPLYHPQDTHWNAFGAAIGFNQLADWAEGRLGVAWSHRYAEDDFELERREASFDLERMYRGIVDEESSQPFLRDDVLENGWMRIERFGERGSEGEGYEIIHYDGVESGERGVVFGDSFFGGLAPYFGHVAEELRVWSDMPTGAEIEAAVEAWRPDFVLEQRVERNLWRVPRRE